MPSTFVQARRLLHCLPVAVLLVGSGLAHATGDQDAVDAVAAAQGRTIPGLEDASVRLEPAQLTAEGTFLVRRRGRLAELPSGEQAFIFDDPEESDTPLRPMVLIPSLTLQRMEHTAEDRNPAMLITGEVFAYRRVNYLLPTAFTIVPPPAEPAEPPPEPVRPDPEIEELIRELERQREQSRIIDPTGPAASPPEPIPDTIHEHGHREAPRGERNGATGLLPEGQMLLRRRGRVIRLGGGQWAIGFDAGPEQETGFDRPLILTPSLNLERLENWAGRIGDQMPLEISGRITQYHGRNYLIPTVFRIYPAVTPLDPIQ